MQREELNREVRYRFMMHSSLGFVFWFTMVSVKTHCQTGEKAKKIQPIYSEGPILSTWHFVGASLL